MCFTVNCFFFFFNRSSVVEYTVGTGAAESMDTGVSLRKVDLLLFYMIRLAQY